MNRRPETMIRPEGSMHPPVKSTKGAPWRYVDCRELNEVTWSLDSGIRSTVVACQPHGSR